MKKRIFAFLIALSLTGSVAKAVSEGDPVLSHIPREDVQSSAIAKVGFSKRRHILEIKFKNGRVYRYLDVSPAVYRKLMAADSKTRYYDRYIKGNYRCFRVRPRQIEEAEN